MASNAAEPELQNLHCHFSVTGTHFRTGTYLVHHNCRTNISRNKPVYADISALFDSKPMSTDKAVASAAALAEVDAVVVVLALVQKYP
jgi:hypothetical protein